MINNFYDKVAKKFGRYSSGVQSADEYPHGQPEQIFKKKLLELSGQKKTALDIGCGDGRFTLSLAKNFSKILGIDTSGGMLDSARKLQRKKHIFNVDFKKQDIHKNNFKKNSFAVVYSRRGPTDYAQFYRILKPGGFYVGIGIGEKDAQPMKEIFGRGQNYGEWSKSYLRKNKTALKKAGFRILYARDFFYHEFYLSYKDLDLFLQSVPIFEDYDSIKDKPLLETYAQTFQTEKGIKLERHRIVIVSQKFLNPRKFPQRKYF